MADQDSNKVDDNSTKDTIEEKTEMEESVAMPDERSEKTNDDTTSPAKETDTKTENKKEESEDSESDDEELVGTLDAPLVVEGKRVRKSTEFLSNALTQQSSGKKPRSSIIPEGRGESLGSMPRVVAQLSKVAGDELKPLHRVLFGRPGNSSEVKKNIRVFNGFGMEKGSKEYKKKEELIDRFTQDSLKRLCEILDIDRKGTKKDNLLETVMDFLMCPKASGKPVEELKRKGSASKKSSTKRKRPAKEKKTTSKKRSEETVESDEESEGEDEKEKDEEEKDDEKEPPAKKSKTSSKKEKKEKKKPAKKEKKVVSIKISPGKKTKKQKVNKKKDNPPSDDDDDEPLARKIKKSPPTNDEIVQLVKELLDGADLEKITMKSVCKQVYERFPDFDLTDRKEFIKESVKEIIT